MAFNIKKLISFRWELGRTFLKHSASSFLLPAIRDFDGRTVSWNVIDGFTAHRFAELVSRPRWINSSSASHFKTRESSFIAQFSVRSKSFHSLIKANSASMCIKFHLEETLSAESFTKPIWHEMQCNWIWSAKAFCNLRSTRFVHSLLTRRWTCEKLSRFSNAMP